MYLEFFRPRTFGTLGFHGRSLGIPVIFLNWYNYSDVRNFRPRLLIAAQKHSIQLLILFDNTNVNSLCYDLMTLVRYPSNCSVWLNLSCFVSNLTVVSFYICLILFFYTNIFVIIRIFLKTVNFFKGAFYT